MNGEGNRVAVGFCKDLDRADSERTEPSHHVAWGSLARQVGALFGSAILLRAFGIIAAPITTRILGPHDYGQLAVYSSVTGFVLIFFRFGFFSTTGMALANCRNGDEQRSLIGSSLVIAGLVGLGYAVCLFCISFFVDEWCHASIGSLLRWTFPFLVFLPLSNLVPLIGRGMNRIDSIVWTKTFPVVMGVGIVVGLWLAGCLQFGLLIQLRAALAVFPLLMIVWMFKPTFSKLGQTMRRLWRANREFGFHLYTGQVADQAAGAIGPLLIPVFAGPKDLGFYALAGALSSQVSGLSNALGMSQYREYAEWPQIPRKILLLNYGYLAIAALGLVILGGPVLTLIAGNKFAGAVPLILPMALMEFFAGAYMPYNSFLSAKACGKWMRNCSLITTVVSLLGNLSLVPMFGAYGAAWAHVFSCAIFYLAVVYYYRRFCQENRQ